MAILCKPKLDLVQGGSLCYTIAKHPIPTMCLQLKLDLTCEWWLILKLTVENHNVINNPCYTYNSHVICSASSFRFVLDIVRGIPVTMYIWEDFRDHLDFSSTLPLTMWKVKVCSRWNFSLNSGYFIGPFNQVFHSDFRNFWIVLNLTKIVSDVFQGPFFWRRNVFFLRK